MLRVILRMLRMARMAPSSSCAESSERPQPAPPLLRQRRRSVPEAEGKEKENDNFELFGRRVSTYYVYYLQLYRTPGIDLVPVLISRNQRRTTE